MATIHRDKLNKLYSYLKAGTPVTSEDLATLGISADLAVYYVRAGWLERLARGVYCRPNDPPALDPSLKLIERSFEGLHVGGKSALESHGIRHYIAQRPLLELYGWKAGRLPDWFTRRFPAEYHRKRLFEESPGALLHIQTFDNLPSVSTPERALLEVLSEVGVRQPLQEARELVESSYSLRADVLAELLKQCLSVKTVRLCLQLGQELSQPWTGKLDPSQLPKGSDRPWVSRSADGLLVLKP